MELLIFAAAIVLGVAGIGRLLENPLLGLALIALGMLFWIAL